MMKISVCIIGLNEEKKIEACLRSVTSIADEIIYIDSNSTDATVEIVQKYTKKIFYKKFNNYVEQKNYASEKASNHWILSLDCDEVLSTNLITSIQDLKNGNSVKNKNITGYHINRLTFYVYRWVKHSGWYPEWNLRLFHREHAKWEGKYIHESVKCRQGEQSKLKGDLLHYSFDSVADHIKTIQNFSEIAAKEAYEKGKRTNLFSLLFRSFWVGVRKMIFELAFLDGGAGFIITGLSVMATFTKYSKLYMIQKLNNK